MVTVRIIGGLGNQMFQYAYAKALEYAGNEVQIDILGFKKYKISDYQLNKYDIDLPVSSLLVRIFSKIGIIKSLKENSLEFNDDFLHIKGNPYIKGYFQSEKYFSNIRGVLLEQFVIKTKLSNSSEEIKQDILKNKENTCSLHIRRGDYVSNKKTNEIHGTCDIEYYKKAMSIINKENNKIKYFVFSDDIDWAKENIEIENVVYIDNKEDKIPHEDIYLMSLCANNITANSSFSWWGAWLNQNNDKVVVCPKIWFADNDKNKESEIACEDWIQI